MSQLKQHRLKLYLFAEKQHNEGQSVTEEEAKPGWGKKNNEETHRKSARLAARQSRAAACTQNSALATIAAGMQSVR